MKKLYYLGLILGLSLGSLTFTSCGDDDNDEPTPTGGEIAGLWTAEYDAKDLGLQTEQGDSKLILTYDFNEDKTFDITTGVEYIPGHWDSALRFKGTYSTANGKVTLNIKKFWEYDAGRNGTEEDRWHTGENSDGSANFSTAEWWYHDDNPQFKNPYIIDYSVTENNLTLANGEHIMLHGFMTYVLTGTLTRQKKVKIFD